jgi:formate hydrogenlyase subunit 6/NADH:ubiquinone oxidoreductase subunit I
VSVCQADAVPAGKEKWRASECLMCNNCDDVCPKNAVSFGFLKGLSEETKSDRLVGIDISDYLLAKAKPRIGIL